MLDGFEGAAPSQADVKKAEYEKKAKAGFDLLQHDLEAVTEPNEQGEIFSEDVKVFSIELQRLRDFPKLRNALLSEIMHRDEVQISLEDGRVIETGNHMSLSSTYGGTQSGRLPENDLKIYTKEQAEQIHQLREEYAKEAAIIDKVRRSYFSKKQRSSEEKSAYDEAENNFSIQSSRLYQKFEQIVSGVIMVSDISSEEIEELMSKVLKARGCTTGRNRVLEINGDEARLNFGPDGSSSFARSVLGFGESDDGLMYKGMDKTLSAFETNFVDDKGQNRRWSSKAD